MDLVQEKMESIAKDEEGVNETMGRSKSGQEKKQIPAFFVITLLINLFPFLCTLDIILYHLAS